MSDVLVDLERCVLAAAMRSREACEHAQQQLGDLTFRRLPHQYLLSHLADYWSVAPDDTTQIHVVVAWLETHDVLGECGGAIALAELWDWVATPANYRHHTHELGIGLALDAVRRAAKALAAEPTSADATTTLEAAQDRLRAARGAGAEPASMVVTGAELRAVLERADPGEGPLPGLLDPEPHLHLLNAAQKTGKTALGLWLSRAWCQGLRVWAETPRLPGSRALFISREQQLSQILRTLVRTEPYAEGSQVDVWTERMDINARGPDLTPEGRRLQTLDDVGMAALGDLMGARAKLDDPYGVAVLDSASRLKPAGLSEKDSDEMTPWLDDLEALACEHQVYLILIHHTGHSVDEHRHEARRAGRGTGAFEAVAQVNLLLERTPEHGVLSLQADGNSIPGSTTVLEVTDHPEPDSVRLHYFRLRQNATSHCVVKPGESISFDAFAARVLELWPGERATGAQRNEAKRLARDFEQKGLITVVKGPRGVMISGVDRKDVPDFGL